MKLIELSQIVSGVLPLDLQTARSGDWVSMKNYNHLTIVFFKGAGTAGDDPDIHLFQAKDNAGDDGASGSSGKDLNFTEIWIKQGTLTAVGTFTKFTQSAGNDYSFDGTSAEDQLLAVLEIDADMLDVDNGFSHVQLTIDDVGNNAQLGCVLYILTDPRHPGTSPPSAL